MIAGPDLLLGATCALAAALSPACTQDVLWVMCCRVTYNAVRAMMPHSRAISLTRVCVSAIAAACCGSIVSKLTCSTRLVPGWVAWVPASILSAYRWGMFATLPTVLVAEYIAWRYNALGLEAPQHNGRVDVEIAINNGRLVVRRNNVAPANEMNRMSSTFLESMLPRRALASGSVCGVCADPVSTDGRVLTCSHVFHADCADSWLMLHSTCPACDMPITRVASA